MALDSARAIPRSRPTRGIWDFTGSSPALSLSNDCDLTPSNCALDILPAELLCLIFEHVLDTHNAKLPLSPASSDDPAWEQWQKNSDRDKKGASLHFTMAPLLLSHVSRRWRLAALSCPSLWANIYVGGRLSELHHIFLWRSKACPISVVVHLRRGGPFSNAMMKRVRRLLVKHMGRFRALSLLCSRHVLHDFIRQSSTRPAPLLEMLVLRVSPFGAPASDLVGPIANTAVFAGFTPRLRQLQLDSLTFPWPMLSTVSLEGLQITWLTLSDVHDQPRSTNVVTMLQRCTALQRLRIFAILRFDSDELASATEGFGIELPNLNNVAITSDNVPWIIGVLFSAYTPRLRTLSLTQTPDSISPSLELPHSNGSLSSVEELYMRHSFVLPINVRQLLPVTPNIRLLVLSEVDHIDDILRCMKEFSLAPNLKVLFLFDCRNLSVSVCIDVIERGPWRPVGPLSRPASLTCFSMIRCEGVDEEEARQIRREVKSLTSIDYNGVSLPREDFLEDNTHL